MRMRRIVALGVSVVALALVGTGAVPAGAAGTAPGEPDYTFVSMPDFLNQDVADLAASECATWDEGDPTSTTPAYEAQLDLVLDEVAREGATDVLVAGDMVEGRWGQDREGTGIFGPVTTYEEQVAAVKRAACTYYPAWRERFDRRGLTTYTAIGDHEIGDNPWGTASGHPYRVFKHRAHRVFKNQWAKYLNEGGSRFADRPRAGQARKTAYAVQLHPEVLLVTVDVFRRTETNVVVGTDRPQLNWLARTLERARARGVDWVLVQGHVPVLGPVRHTQSSWPKVSFRNGPESRFWRLLARYDVDAYLAGEVHATTAQRRNGVTQISHGGLMYAGQVSYLVGRVYGRRLELTTHGFDVVRTLAPSRLWQTDRRVGTFDVAYAPESHVTGTMRLRRDGKVLYRSGLLAPYNP